MPTGENTEPRKGLFPFGETLPPRPEPLRVVLLGATGSIGRQALDVVKAHPGRFLVAGLSCRANTGVLRDMLVELRAIQPDLVPLAAVTDAEARGVAADGLAGLARLVDAEGNSLVTLVREAGADCLVNGLVGAVGLEPTLAAAGLGMRVALANKETLVMGGDLVAAAVAAGGAEILPVDSEHAAIAQCLGARPASEVARLVLTASGGPFRETPARELAHVTLERVLAHPTWDMGPKITVDSATLMNKGLEVIEAHHLFGVPYDAIDVVVHPGSVVHSLVEFVDGALVAQLGTPDMRLPLQYAMSGLRHLPLAGECLDLAAVGALRFERPDTRRFPCLDLARRAGREGGSAPIVLNAANEVAVAALLAGSIGFTDIGAVVSEALARMPRTEAPDLETVLGLDAEARRLASAIVAGLAG